MDRGDVKDRESYMVYIPKRNVLQKTLLSSAKQKTSPTTQRNSMSSSNERIVWGTTNSYNHRKGNESYFQFIFLPFAPSSSTMALHTEHLFYSSTLANGFYQFRTFNKNRLF